MINYLAFIFILPTFIGINKEVDILFTVNCENKPFVETNYLESKWPDNLEEEDNIEIKLVNSNPDTKYRFTDIGVQVIFEKEVPKRQIGPIIVGEDDQWTKRFAIVRTHPVLTRSKTWSKKKNVLKTIEFQEYFLQEPTVSIPFEIFSQDCLSRLVFKVKGIEKMVHGVVEKVKFNDAVEYSFYCKCDPCIKI